MSNNAIQSAFSQLDPNWKKWVIDAIQLGCTTESMIDAMVKTGPFSKNSARTVLLEAEQELAAGEVQSILPPLLTARPDINTVHNCLAIEQQCVDILVSVNNPRIVVMRNVLSDEECEELIAYAERKLTRSLVVSAENAESLESPTRTSSYAMFQRGETDLHKTIEKRLATLANWPIEKGEGLQVLHYEKGEHYIPHYDWFDSKLPGHQERLKIGGQRVGTFVLYLSDVEAGGGTSFPKLELEVRPQRGMAVFFANIGTDGQTDSFTLHGAEPVITGVKWVATKWLRADNF
jgi:prolyl 4-hydroxylase